MNKAVRVIICPCGAIKTIEYTASVKEVVENTGFSPLLSYNNGIHYICPECWEKVVELCQELYGLTGIDDPYIKTIITKGE
jgi:hypothetical protein